MGVTFGISYADIVTIPEHGSCGDFELATDAWSASGEGTAVTWGAAQTSQLVEVYWFAAYDDDGTPDLLSLVPHPTQGADFADDDVPSNIDPIAALGEFGFNTDGYAPCPPSVQPGACCFEDGSCEVLLPDDCATAGGSFQGPGVVCDPCLSAPTVPLGRRLAGQTGNCSNRGEVGGGGDGLLAPRRLPAWRRLT